MQRNPAIHIRLSDLIRILNFLKVDNADQLAYSLLKESAKYNIKGRVFVMSNKRVANKVKRIIDNDIQLVDLFNKALSMVLLENKILYAKPISQTSRQYIVLKEVTKSAIQFCDLYNIDYSIGFIEFCRLAIELLKKSYSIYKFKMVIPQISKRYENKRILENDENKEGTKEVYSIYKNKALIQFGIDYTCTDIDEYIHFYNIRKLCDSRNIPYNDWINTQFDKLSFTGTLPLPKMLYGEKAINRFNLKNTSNYVKETISEKIILKKDVFKKRKVSNDIQ